MSIALFLSQRWVHTVFRIRRNEDVAAHVHAGPRPFLKRDNRQAVEKVVQHLFSLRGRLLRDAIANLRRRIKDAAVVADLGQAAKAADGRCRAKGQQIPVIDLRGESCCAQWIETDVLVEVERKTIWAYCAVEGDEHLALLSVAHALHGADKPRTLRHQELLVVMRVIIGREHDQDRPAEPAVNVVGNNTLKNRALEDPVETALILVEVIRTHRVCLGCSLRLCWSWLARRYAL